MWFGVLVGVDQIKAKATSTVRPGCHQVAVQFMFCVSMNFVMKIGRFWSSRSSMNYAMCISMYISGNDRYGYEKASERWLPIHTVETILISVISMLADPNDESPANVDAAKEWRENYPDFK